MISPEKNAQLKKTMDGLKSQFADFKEQFEKVEHEISLVNEDIAHRDLEKDEPLPKLAAEIERLCKTTFEVKDLKVELEKIQIEIQAKSTLLSSMDTEKKLKQLLSDLEGAGANEEAVWLALKKVRDVSGAYVEGYTSGAEDEEFCTVANSEAKDLMADFDAQGKGLKDLEREIQALLAKVEEKKQGAGGNLKAEDVEDLNEQIGRLEARLGKARRSREEISQAAFSNKDKLAQHDVDQKLGRRMQEIEELDKIVADINVDNANMR